MRLLVEKGAAVRFLRGNRWRSSKWLGAIAVTCAGGTLALASNPAQQAVPVAGTAAADQLAAGAAAYATHCAACHGADLIGLEHTPNLKGETFWANWSGKPARLLYSRIISTMPLSDPGSLEPKEALDITAHILSINRQPIPAAGYGGADELNEVPLARTP
jgi:S-disulfanyl-L-cysteine oxidoreductase SoxD